MVKSIFADILIITIGVFLLGGKQALRWRQAIGSRRKIGPRISIRQRDAWLPVELMFSLKSVEELIWTCQEDFSLYYYLLALVMMYGASKIKTVDRSNTFRSVYPTPCILYLVRKLEYTCFNGTFKVSTVQFKVSKKHKGYFNA